MARTVGQVLVPRVPISLSAPLLGKEADEGRRVGRVLGPKVAKEGAVGDEAAEGDAGGGGADEVLWGEKAEEFWPERFMDGAKAAADFKGRDFQFLPFGAGRRICPGMGFGLATVEVMLANLVYCFDWELPDGMQEEDVDMADMFGVTMRRKEKLVLVPRIPQDANI